MTDTRQRRPNIVRRCFTHAKERKHRSLAPLIAAVAVGYCVSACGGGTAATDSGTPPASGQPASPGTSSASAMPTDQSQGATTGVGSRTPGAALTHWIRQVAAGNRSAACQAMREPGISAQRATARCMSPAGASTFKALHNLFGGIRPNAPIIVSAVQVQGASATVASSHVRVSRTPLDSLMAARGSGVKPGQLSIIFKLSRMEGAWYVSDMKLKADIS